jgi:hypothetical protein
MDGWKGGWLDRQRDGQMDVWINMDGWIDGKNFIRLC